MACIFDERWCGEHGIGRFAREIAERLEIKAYKGHGRPMSPWDPIRLSYRISKKNIKDDWFFSPGYNAPLLGGIPYILTIHDLNHIDRPENSSIAKQFYYKLILRHLSLRARAVLTVSEFSRQRLISWMGLDSERVFNVGNGVSEVFSIEGNKWGEGAEYVLCVSNRRGHKNEPAVIAGFATSGLPQSVKLIFTGDESKLLFDLAYSLGVGDRVAFTGRVSEETLASIYRGAICLCFASLYEGFGLPIIEAFASGIPVITSNVTSMPEIAGDAALLVDPHNSTSIANALRCLYDDSNLRALLVQRGLVRVRQFTWDSVVKRIKTAVATVDDDPENRLNWY
jgi:glycosyltransferase involved in cell wall biosynthesis